MVEFHLFLSFLDILIMIVHDELRGVQHLWDGTEQILQLLHVCLGKSCFEKNSTSLIAVTHERKFVT